jgi:hypothetical protein
VRLFVLICLALLDNRTLPAEITEIAWKAQNRLHKRYMTLMARGKEQRKTMTAVARELLGFIWAIGIKAEAACKRQMTA